MDHCCPRPRMLPLDRGRLSVVHHRTNRPRWRMGNTLVNGIPGEWIVSPQAIEHGHRPRSPRSPGATTYYTLGAQTETIYALRAGLHNQHLIRSSILIHLAHPGL